MTSITEQWAEYATPHTYDSGSYVFREGDPADQLYLIASGHVAVIKGADGEMPVVLSYRTNGELIGEIGLLYEGDRTASVIALEPTKMLAMPKADFWKVFNDKPEFRSLVMKTIIDRLLIADESRVGAAASDRRVIDRLSALADENQQLAALMQLREETLGFIVHDLRNPLNLVQMALSMIELDPGYSQDADSRRFLAMAVGGVRRMRGLVDSLLDVERLESGEASLSTGTVEMAPLVDELIEQSRPLAWASQLTLEVCHNHDSLPVLSVDRERIGRVITNLLDNAIKFSPPDGIIRMTTDYADGRVYITVEDSGPGIPADERERMFERFAQAQGGRGSRGFGLGLTYCRTAVQAHGGKIWVEDPQDLSGARFVFWLPVPAGE